MRTVRFIFFSIAIVTLSISAFASDYDVNPGTYSGSISKNGQNTKKECIVVVKDSLYDSCKNNSCGTNVDVRISQQGYVLATAISIDAMGISPYSSSEIPTASTEDSNVTVTGDVSSELDTRGYLKSVTINFQDKWDNDSVFVTCDHLKLLGARN
jgi:hypothetical protein